MKIQRVLALLVLLAGAVAMPAMAQQPEAAGAAADGQMAFGMLGAAFAIGIAAAFGALGQAKAVAAACSAMARNPGSAANVRFALILGLALIESLVLYALLIAMRGAGIF